MHFKWPILAAVVTLAWPLGTHAQQAETDFPERPVEISAYGSAGGGTDTVSRYLAEAMQKPLGGRINVANRTGGGGGVAMSHIWNREHDGYAWLGAAEGMQIVKVMGFHDTSTKDWRWYMVGGSPAVISVPANSRFDTFDALMDAAKADAGAVKVGHSPIGGVWHLKALSLALAADTEFNHIPFEGSAPAQVAALTGEVDAVVSSISEQSEFIRSGKYRPLAMIGMDSYTIGDLTIPAAGTDYPDIQDIPAQQWLGIGIPGDTPQPIIAKIDAAFDEAMQSDKIKSLAAERYYVLSGKSGAAAEEELLAMERAVSQKLYELGIADKDPATLEAFNTQ